MTITLIESSNWDAPKVKIALNDVTKLVGNNQRGFEIKKISTIPPFSIYLFFLVSLTSFFVSPIYTYKKNYEDFFGVSL